MSIPKEPRQLMINLMYLVLTALLALNISAEVMNAFFTLNKGISQSNEIVGQTNDVLLANIAKQAEAYKSEETDKFAQQAKDIKATTDEFHQYVEDLKKELFEAAGGPSEKNPEQPKRIKDKDVTTRLLVGVGESKGKGYELEQKIRDTKAKLEALVNNDPSTVASMPLGIDDEAVAKSDKSDWVGYNFLQMPVAAVFPILTKLQNDAKASSSAAYNFILGKVAGEDIKFDAFQPVVSASKGYVVKGEKYSAEVFLSAYSTTAGDNTRILVNGSSLPVKEGKALYETTTTQLGTKQYNVEIQVTNPLTGEMTPYKKQFEYEVGERSVTVSADKMNVFYMGVENPVSVSAAGVSSNDLQVSISGGEATLKKVGSANYIVEAKKPTLECIISISAPSIGLKDSKVFRVKPFPTPTAKLGNKSDGAIGNGEFKAQLGVAAILENFDFDARCNIVGYTVYRAEPRKDLKLAANEGSKFGGKAASLINEARPGDTYYFQDIKAKCPGDVAARTLNSMVFQIR